MTNNLILIIMLSLIAVLWFIICKDEHYLKRNVLRFSSWIMHFFRF